MFLGWSTFHQRYELAHLEEVRIFLKDDFERSLKRTKLPNRNVFEMIISKESSMSSHRFMMFMVALAVGTLAGSGILVLVPEVSNVLQSVYFKIT